jgi:DNA mismatch repair protein MutL
LEDEHSPDALGALLQKVLLETVASASCHGSVRAGQALSRLEAEALISQMSETDFAGHCPHGRPTTVRLKWSDLERMFKRTL